MRCYKGDPEVNAGKKFENIDLNQMECTADPKVTHSLLTILIVLLVAVMLVLLYLNRGRVQNNVKPLMDNFQRSMQYSSIEKVINIFSK